MSPPPPTVYCKSGGVTAGSTVRDCAAGLIYVCGEDNGGATVWKLDKGLNILWSYDTNATANSLDVDAQGNVYIAHNNDGSRPAPDGDVVTKLDKNGNLVWKAATYFTYPTTPLSADLVDVSHVPGTLDVWVTEGLIAYRLDSSGVQQVRINGGGTPRVSATRVCTDENENAYISEDDGLLGPTPRDVVRKYDKNGTLLAGGTGPLTNHTAAYADLLYRGGKIYTNSAYSSNGSNTERTVYNASDMSVHASDTFAGTGAFNKFWHRIAWANGGLIRNIQHQVVGAPATFNVSDSYLTAEATGLGGAGGDYYAAASVRNDKHTGATATVLRDVFKYDANANLLKAIDLGGGNIINHLIVV